MITAIGLILLSLGYAAAVPTAYGRNEWAWLIIPATAAGVLAFYLECRDLRPRRRIGGVGMFTLAFSAPAAAVMWLVVNDPAATGPALSFMLGYVALALLSAVAAAVGTVAVLLDV